MEPFENMKGKLREESPLPEGFGWEDMQEGIFEKMANKAAPEDGKKRFYFSKWTFFCLGMVTMLVMNVLFHFVNNRQQTLDNNQEVISQLSTSNQPIKPFKEGHDLSREEQLNTEKAATQISRTIENYPTDLINSIPDKESISPQLAPTTISIKEPTTKIKIEGKATNLQKGGKKTIEIEQENSLLNNTKESKAATNKTVDKISEQANSLPNIEALEQSTDTAPLTAFNNKLNPLKTAGSIISTKNDKSVWILSALEQKPLKVLNQLYLPNINPLSLSNPLAVEKRANNARFSMAIGVGLNYWTPNWGSSSLSQERAQYEKALIGNTYSLLFDYQLHPKWSIGTGLMNTTYYSQFNYEETDTYQKVKTGVLVEIQVNTITGDSTQIFGDRTINVNRQRQVVHYNTFKKWSVPLLVKYNIRKRKVAYALGIGAMLTLKTETAGKTINSTIQDYSTASPIYQAGTEIGAMGTFDLNYHLSEKYFIGAQLSGIASLKNWSTEIEVALKPLILNSQLTLGLKF